MAAGCREARDTQTLNYSELDEPRRLDPPFVKDLYEGVVSGFLYDGLVRFGHGAEIEPALAEQWQMADDGKSYRFQLRDAKFSNGKNVTSGDVRYSFTRVLLPATGSDRKWVLDRISGADDVIAGRTDKLSGLATPNDRTVVVTLKEAYPVFLTMLAMPTAAIIPEGSAGHGTPDKSFDRSPIGSGPWRLSNWIRDQKLEFLPNAHYWGGGPKLGKLAYHVQTQETIRLRMFDTGKLDITEIGFSVFDTWMADKSRAAMTTSVQELRTDYLGMMCSKPRLSDRRVRQAIACAIDAEGIFSHIQKGRGVRAKGMIPPGIPGHRSELASHAADPAKARRLLADAGAQGLQLELWFRQEPLNAEICAAIQQDLKTAGMQVRLMPRDQAALRTAIHEGGADLFLGSWTLDYPDVENALYPPFHSRNIPRMGNGSHFSDTETDRLLDDARQEREPDARLRKYQLAEDRIIDECPWAPLFHRRKYYAVQPALTGWTPALIYNADRFNEATKR